MERRPVTVSLFDKDSVSQDFTKNLNALLSRADLAFSDCVTFLQKSEYPSEGHVPSLSSYSTASIIKLLDALTYLLHGRAIYNYRLMVDLVASELAGRAFLSTADPGIGPLLDCVTCLSRIAEPYMQVRLLIYKVNKEVRSNAELLLNRGQFVEVLSSLAYILHPSTIDLIVYTCCSGCHKLTPSDLSQLPKLLTKFKIAHTGVISPLLSYVVQSPSAAFNSNTQLCQNFLSDVSHMTYMENGDGHIIETPGSRLCSLLLNGIVHYSEEEMQLILRSIPCPENLPSDARKQYGFIIGHILSRLGIFVKTEDGFDVNKNITTTLRALSIPQLVTVTDTITRFDIFHEYTQASAVSLQTAILMNDPVVELPQLSRQNTLLECLLSELAARIEVHMNSPHKAAHAVIKSINDAVTVVRLVDRMSVDAYNSDEGMLNQLLDTVLVALNKETELNFQSLKCFVEEVLKCGSLVHRMLAKSAFLTLMSQKTNWDVPSEVLRQALRLLQLYIANIVKHGMPFDVDFVKDAVPRVVETAKSISDSFIGKRRFYETISHLILILHEAVEGGCNESALAVIMPDLEKIMIDGLKSAAQVITPQALRNIVRLPSESRSKTELNGTIMTWSQARDAPEATTLTLDSALTYILTTCEATVEEPTRSSEELERLSPVTEMAVSLLEEFKVAIDSHFSRKGYGNPGAKAKDHHAWETTVGLKPLFRRPEEPLDIFILSKMASLPNYFCAEQYKGISHKSDSVTSLFQLKQHLQRIRHKYTAIELLLTRQAPLEDGRRDTLSNWLDVISKINKGILQCILAVEMAIPAWQNTYLPRRHTRRLVDSALKRFTSG